MSAHTPGPWKIAQYDNFYGYSIWANGSGCIAERWYSTPREDAPIMANARLIAAAPEMLEALKEAERSRGGVCPLCREGAGHHSACSLGNAIAKAEGRE